MKLLPRFALAALLLVALPSCNGDSPTPSQPNPSPAPPGPAQVTMSVRVVQAGSTTNIDSEVSQQRSFEGVMEFSAASGLSDAVLTEANLSGSLQSEALFSTTIPFNRTLPAGTTTSVPFDVPFSVNRAPLFQGGNNPPLSWTINAHVGDGVGGTINLMANGSTSSGNTRTVGIPCAEDPTTLCMFDERFRVTVDWQDFVGASGPGFVAARFPPNGGHFYFFTPNNIDLVIDVLDRCGSGNNNRFWVFFAATTNVEYTIRVEDTRTNTVRTYVNPLGETAPTITDTAAFATCP